MSDNVIELIEHQEAIFRARLAGKSVRKIASEFRMSISNVQEIIQRQAPTIDNNLRLMTCIS
jgi:transposase